MSRWPSVRTHTLCQKSPHSRRHLTRPEVHWTHNAALLWNLCELSSLSGLTVTTLALGSNKHRQVSSLTSETQTPRFHALLWPLAPLPGFWFDMPIIPHLVSLPCIHTDKSACVYECKLPERLWFIVSTCLNCWQCPVQLHDSRLHECDNANLSSRLFIHIAN